MFKNEWLQIEGKEIKLKITDHFADIGKMVNKNKKNRNNENSSSYKRKMRKLSAII